MFLIPRIAAFLAFWGLALFVPGWLVSRALWPNDRDHARWALGMLVVLAVAFAFELAFHMRMSRMSIALAGGITAIVATGMTKRRGAGKP